MPSIYLSPPDVGALEIERVQAALKSGWVAPIGPDLEAFEREVATLCGRSFGVGLSSGTAALHLGLLALGVRPGDIVLTSTMTFVATANSILHAGGIPVFIDSDFDTGNISTALLEQALFESHQDGQRVGAILPVDFLGKAANHSGILELANRYQVPVLVDSAEALGATHGGKPSASYGDAAIISFNGNKIATTSGGGMLLTDDPDIASRVRFLSSQSRIPAEFYQHAELGYNYRLSNVLAALGRAQVARLPEMIQRRRRLRDRYRKFFDKVVGVEVYGSPDEFDNCWLTSILVDPSKVPWSVTDLMRSLQISGIESRPLWKPMHLQPLFAGAKSYDNGSSEALFGRGLSLPSGSNLSEPQLRTIFLALEDFLSRNSSTF